MVYESLGIGVELQMGSQRDAGGIQRDIIFAEVRHRPFKCRFHVLGRVHLTNRDCCIFNSGRFPKRIRDIPKVAKSAGKVSLLNVSVQIGYFS